MAAGAPLHWSALVVPVPAVLKLARQAVQAGCGAVRLPPADQVPLGHKVAHVDPDPVLPGWQMATVNRGVRERRERVTKERSSLAPCGNAG